MTFQANISDFMNVLEKRLTVRLSADSYQELENLARAEGFSSSQIVRHLIIRYLQDKRRYGMSEHPLTATFRGKP